MTGGARVQRQNLCNFARMGGYERLTQAADDVPEEQDIRAMGAYASNTSVLLPLEGIAVVASAAPSDVIAAELGNPAVVEGEDEYDLEEPSVPFKQQLRDLWRTTLAWVQRNPIKTAIAILLLCGVVVLAVFFLRGAFTPLLIKILADVQRLGPGVWRATVRHEFQESITLASPHCRGPS